MQAASCVSQALVPQDSYSIVAFVNDMALHATALPEEYTRDNLESLAAPFASDAKVVNFLYVENWATLAAKIDSTAIDGALCSPKKHILNLAKAVYQLSLSNDITHTIYSQTIARLATLEKALQPAFLENCVKETEEVLKLLGSNGPKADERLALLKTRLSLVHDLTFLCNPIQAGRIRDLAAYFLGNPRDSGYDLQLFGRIERLCEDVVRNKARIELVCEQRARLFIPEREWNKARSFSLPNTQEPTHPLYRAFFMPNLKAIMGGAFLFLQRLLIQDIRTLGSHPGQNKKNFKEALVDTLAFLRKSKANIPSWKKLVKENPKSLGVLIDTEFLSLFWAKFFEKQPLFDIEQFAWVVVQAADQGQINRVQEQLQASEKTQNEVVYALRYEERPQLIQNCDQERAGLTLKQLFLPQEARFASFAALCN